MTRFINPAPDFSYQSILVSGGLMFFFNSGTMTEKDTFKDAAQTIPNTHPVELDAAGVLPNVFFSGAAKVILQTALGQQVFERDPVGGGVTTGDFSEFDAGTIYNIGNIVRDPSNNLFYESFVNGNLNKPPASSPASWKEIRFIGVYNANVDYKVGEIVQIADGSLFRSKVTPNKNNEPSVSFNKWENIFHNKVVGLTGGGDLSDSRINQLQDSLTYDLPLAVNYPSGKVVEVEKREFDRLNTPVVQVKGTDLIAFSGGTDTSYTLNQAAQESQRFTSNGVDRWSI